MTPSPRGSSSRRLLFALALLAGLVLAAASASATPARLARRSQAEGGDPFAYWTRERMLAARPVPMPEPAAGVESRAEGSPEPVVRAPGAGPTIQLPPEPAPAAVDDDGEAAEPAVTLPEDATDVDAPAFSGTSGCHFSSSRLNPRTIDTKYPYSAVGKLFFTKPGVGDFVCSGAVLRPRVVLTAGHCVHAGNGLQTGYFTNFLFCPAYRGGPSAKFGCWGWTAVGTTSAWWTSNNVFPNAADFGMLEIQDRTILGVPTRIGAVTGWLGYATSSLTANHVHLLGYPVDFSGGARMHQVASGRCTTGGNNSERYGSDMRGGSSGGPWVQDFGVPASGQSVGPSGPNLIVGVTSYSNTSTDPKYQGSSIPDSRFTSLLTVICDRDQTPPANCF